MENFISRPELAESTAVDFARVLEKRAEEMIGKIVEWSKGTDEHITAETRKNVRMIQIDFEDLYYTDVRIYRALLEIYEQQPTAGTNAYKEGCRRIFTGSIGNLAFKKYSL